MKPAYIALFAVIYNDDEGKKIEEHGVGLAKNFPEVAHYLETELYGDSLVEITHIELLDACPVLSKETWELMRKELNEG